MNFERKTKKLSLIFVLATFLCTIAAIALRTVNILSFYDAQLGYFEKSALPTIMNIILFIFPAAFLATSIIFERKNGFDKAFACPNFFKISSAICAPAVIGAAIYSAAHSELTKASVILVISSVICAAYFALYLSKKIPSCNTVLALFPVIICVVILAVTYFDVFTTMNSPHKVLIHIACLSSMLGFLADARLLADNQKKKNYHFYIALATFFTGVSSIPAVILYFLKAFDYAYVDYDIFFLVFFIYFAARTLTFVLKGKNDAKENEEASSEQ